MEAKDGYNLISKDTLNCAIPIGQYTPYSTVWWLKLEDITASFEENFHYDTLIWSYAFLETYRTHLIDYITKYKTRECKKVIKKYEPIVEGSFYAFLEFNKERIPNYDYFIKFSASNRYFDTKNKLLCLTNKFYEKTQRGIFFKKIKKVDILTHLSRLILSTPDPEKAMLLLFNLQVHQFKNIQDLMYKIAKYFFRNDLGCFLPDYHEIFRDGYISLVNAITVLGDIELFRKAMLAIGSHLFLFRIGIIIDPIDIDCSVLHLILPTTPLLFKSREGCLFEHFKSFGNVKREISIHPLKSYEQINDLSTMMAGFMKSEFSRFEEHLLDEEQPDCSWCRKTIESIKEKPFINFLIEKRPIGNDFINMGAVASVNFGEWLIQDSLDRSFDSIQKLDKYGLLKKSSYDPEKIKMRLLSLLER